MTVDSARASYDALSCYTLGHGHPSFIHQHVVDAFAAQAADAHTKPITLTFALVGLYLHVEKQFTGRQVQLAHMKLARRKHPWPPLALPRDRGAMTAADVLEAPAGSARDEAIHAWCRVVWEAFQDNRQTIADLLRAHEIA